MSAELPKSPADEQGSADRLAAAYTRVCRRCSAQATTDADRCPACGARYARRRPSRKLIASALAAVVVIGGGGTATAMVSKHRSEVREQKRVARVTAARNAAEAKRKAAAEAAEREQKAEAQLLKTLRESYELELRKAVTKSAQKAYDDGLMDGRATGSSCDNTDGNIADEDASSAAYDCLAITKHNDDGTVSGYRYTGRINYDDGTMTWKLGA